MSCSNENKSHKEIYFVNSEFDFVATKRLLGQDADFPLDDSVDDHFHKHCHLYDLKTWWPIKAQVGDLFGNSRNEHRFIQKTTQLFFL